MSDQKRYSKGQPINPMKAIETRWAIKRIDLVEDERKTVERKSKRKNIQYEKLRAIIDRTIERVNDAEGIMELLPDLNLVREILVASILSPKDLVEIKLEIATDNPLIPPTILEKVRQHFTTNYNLESKMSKILAEALFNKGSYILLPLPAQTISTAMQANSRALESLNLGEIGRMSLPNIGLIGHRAERIAAGTESINGPVYAMEAWGKEFLKGDPHNGKYLQITDNPMWLAAPTLKTIVQRVNVRKQLKDSLGLEGINLNSMNDPSPYARKMYDMVESVLLKNEPIQSLAENLDPIIMNLPPESVIPVFVPGEPENHRGYYVVLDEFGNPITAAKNSNFFKELNERLESSVQGNGFAMIKTNLSLQGATAEQTAESMVQPLMDAYISQIEDELREGLKNGAYGEYLEVARPQEIYRLMFARQLQKMYTRVLYIPAEMLTYVAFDHDELGIGVSLIEKTKLYSSLRAILMFADVVAGVKNSIPARTLKILLDEVDPDPQGTVESALNEFVALQSNLLPLGRLNPSDILDGLARSSINVDIDGGETFPGTKIDVEDYKRDVTKSDSDLAEFLKKQQYGGMGVSPELADKSLEGEFATSIVQSNLLQSKRVMVWQDIFTYHLSDHIHKYILSGGPLFAQIKSEWEAMQVKNKPSLEEVINSLYVVLPRPDTAAITAQKTSFEEYSMFLDLAVPAYVNEDMLRSLLKGSYAPDALAAIQNTIISLMKRQYLTKQNMLPELEELISGEDNKQIVEVINQHNELLLTVIGGITDILYKTEYKLVDKPSAAAEAEVNALKEADNPDATNEEGGGDEGAGDTGGDTGGEGGGGDYDMSDDVDTGDLGMSDDGGTGEDTGGEPAPASVEEPTEPEGEGDDTTVEEPAEPAADVEEPTTQAKEPAGNEPTTTEEPTEPVEEEPKGDEDAPYGLDEDGKPRKKSDLTEEELKELEEQKAKEKDKADADKAKADKEKEVKEEESKKE